MCKIFCVPTIEVRRSERLLKAMPDIAGILTGGADDDGFGYAAVDARGRMYGERWLDVAEAFRVREVAPDVRCFPAAAYEAADCGDWDFWGRAPQRVCRALVAHARQATCAVNLANTHPIRGGGVALVHNGVVRSDKLRNVNSSCDSELLIKAMLSAEYAVRGPEAMQEVADAVSGSYAFAALSRTGRRWHCDVVADDSTPLYAAHSAALGAVMFCTSADYLRRIVALFGERCRAVMRVKRAVAVRFAVGGSLVPTVIAGFRPRAAASVTGGGGFGRQWDFGDTV